MFADIFPRERLGVALSIFYMGVFLGQSLALLVGGTTVEAVSHMSSITLPLLGTMAPWRITFLVAASPGIPFALQTTATFSPEPSRAAKVTESPNSTLTEPGVT